MDLIPPTPTGRVLLCSLGISTSRAEPTIHSDMVSVECFLDVQIDVCFPHSQNILCILISSVVYILFCSLNYVYFLLVVPFSPIDHCLLCCLFSSSDNGCSFTLVNNKSWLITSGSWPAFFHLFLGCVSDSRTSLEGKPHPAMSPSRPRSQRSSPILAWLLEWSESNHLQSSLMGETPTEETAGLPPDVTRLWDTKAPWELHTALTAVFSHAGGSVRVSGASVLPLAHLSCRCRLPGTLVPPSLSCRQTHPRPCQGRLCGGGGWRGGLFTNNCGEISVKELNLSGANG